MKIQESRKYFVLFYMSGFLAGILCANLLSGKYLADIGFFNEFFLNQYIQTEIHTGDYFWYLLKIRSVPIILLTILGCTRFRKASVVLFLMWTGFLSGMVLTTAVIQMGFSGIILCVVGFMPHFLLYIAGYFILLWCLFGYPKSQWNMTKTVCFFLLMIVGLILECCVNPVLVKLILKTL